MVLVLYNVVAIPMGLVAMMFSTDDPHHDNFTLVKGFFMGYFIPFYIVGQYI
jgi:hypothetical protein